MEEHGNTSLLPVYPAPSLPVYPTPSLPVYPAPSLPVYLTTSLPVYPAPSLPVLHYMSTFWSYRSFSRSDPISVSYDVFGDTIKFVQQRVNYPIIPSRETSLYCTSVSYLHLLPGHTWFWMHGLNFIARLLLSHIWINLPSPPPTQPCSCDYSICELNSTGSKWLAWIISE